MMEAASTSEMSANFYQTTQRNDPEDKSYLFNTAYLKNWGGGLVCWY
jgi:hypothetical protein